MLRAFVFALFLAFALSARSHAGKQTLEDQYLNTYLQINEADKLEKSGDLRGAYAIYFVCHKQLLIMCKADPDFQIALGPLENKLKDLQVAFSVQHLAEPWRGRP